MSAAPQTSSPAPAHESQPAPQGIGWISVAEAAQRSGKSVGHINRMCLKSLCAAGLARKVRSRSGQEIWEVREDADPLFGRVKFPEVLQIDRSKYTQAQYEELIARRDILQRWEAAMAEHGAIEGTARVVDELRAGGRRISPRTLYNWRDAYRANGAEGLADERWQPKAKGRDDDPFFAELRRWYLTEQEPSKSVCYRMARAAARKAGWTITSYRAACRYLAGLNAHVVTLGRKGETEYTNKLAPYHERDYSFPSNQWWCSDHHPCDVMVQHPTEPGKFVRPWLTCFEDLRSRKIVGWSIYVGDPNAVRVIEAFEHAVLGGDGRDGHGVPEMLLIDNGKDFDCYSLQGQTKMERRKVSVSNQFAGGVAPGGVFGQLRIGVHHALPFNARSKPVERFFRIFNEEVDRLQPTYCGNSPEDKPEWLYERLEAGKAPTLAEYAAAASAWIDEVYNVNPESRARGREGRRPTDVWKEELLTLRTATPDELRFGLMIPSPPLVVGRNGVTFQRRTYGRGEPALYDYARKQVILRIDPRDVSRGYIFTREGKPVCPVTENRLTGFNSAVPDEEFRQAVKKSQRIVKQTKDALRQGMRMHVDPVEQLILDRAEDNRKRAASEGRKPPQPPASIQPIRTPLQAALPALQQAFNRPRIAVGAESMVDLSSLRAPAAADDQPEFVDPLSALRRLGRKEEDEL